MNNKEVVKRIESIFESIKCSCYIDSLIRIDENIYDCEKCALVDTINRNISCPLIIKENLKGVE